jgi:aspartyl-tRNA(Asn)/glutamyl-tRNA(Gln) amidotransferase subunit A
VKGIASLTQAYASGRISPVEEVEKRLADIASRDPVIRAFTSVDEAGARRAASQSHTRWQAGKPLSPLDGVPIAIKDNIAVEHLPLTAGMAHRRGMIADADSAITARLRAAGAIIIGMANMHEAALGATTDNPFYGRTDNPAFPGHMAGGSSGGSAAAVAAGFVALAMGTDTMGSVRLPAAYCGVCGLKPTTGILPMEGVVALSETLDTAGPIAATVNDLAIAWPVLSAGGEKTVQRQRPRFAVLSTTGTEVEPYIFQAFSAAIGALKAAGHDCPEIGLKGWNPSALRRAGLLIVEWEGANVHRAALEQGLDMSPDLRAMLDYGRNLPAERLAAAREMMGNIAAEASALFGTFDALLLPSTPQTPLVHGAKAPSSQADLTALASLAGLPALSLPLPVAPGAAPVGLQMIGAKHCDAQLLESAAFLSQEIAG